MSKGEKFVFGVLALTTGAGLLDMATSPWRVQPSPEEDAVSDKDAASKITTATDDDQTFKNTLKSKEVVKFSD